MSVTVTHSHVTTPWLRADSLELGWEEGAGFSETDNSPSAHRDTWLLAGILESLALQLEAILSPRGHLTTSGHVSGCHRGWGVLLAASG